MMNNYNDNKVMDRALVYTRKSTEDKEKQIASISDQLQEAEKLIESNNLYKVKVFTEEKSGKESGVRTAFYEMLKLIEKGKANVIVCWKADRLSRNGTDGGRLIELIDNGKLKIITAFGEYDKTNSIMLWVDFGFSTKYSKDLSDNVKRRLKAKAEMGIRPGRAPPGFLNTPHLLKGQRQILVDPLRFPLMRKWWELVLGGMTIKDSLKVMTNKGLTDYRGNKIKYAKAARMFRNIFYAGIFDYGGIRYKGSYKKLVTLKEFIRIQKILDHKHGKQKKIMKLPFQGMMQCGECGSTITGESHKRGFKTFWYYRCKKNKGTKCGQQYLNADEINPQIKAYLSSMEIHPLFAEWVKKVLRRQNTSEFNTSKSELELKTKQLNEIESKKEVLCKMRIDELITEEDYRRKAKKLLTDEETLKEANPMNRTDYWMRVVSLATKFSERMIRLYEKDDVYVKQMVLKILGSNIFIYDKKVDIQAKSIFIGLKYAEKEYFVKNLSVEHNLLPYLLDKKKFLPTQKSFCAENVTKVEHFSLFNDNDTTSENDILLHQLVALDSYLKAKENYYA